MSLNIFALTKNGARLGERLCTKTGAARLYLPEKFKREYCNAGFFGDFKESVRRVFEKSDGIIFIMAAGIVVRTIAPLLRHKTIDPAVLVIDEKGKNVISLISGHFGGANKLAKMTAKKIGARPVITTATDVNGLPCIEDIAERFNLIIEDINPGAKTFGARVKKVKAVNSAMVNGEIVSIIDEDAKRLNAIKRFLGKKDSFTFSQSLLRVKQGKPDVSVIVSHKLFSHRLLSPSRLLLRPRDLVVGIGCDRGVRISEVEEAYLDVLKKWKISPLSVRNLASIDVKKDEKGLLRFAKKHKLSIEFYSKKELSTMPLPSGFSQFVMEKIGVGGVCEPAALKSAGTKKIWVKKQKRGRVTIAIAQAPFSLSV